MAAYNKIADWVANEGEVADLDDDVFRVALSNIAPGNETTPPTNDGQGVLANVTEIDYSYCSDRLLSQIYSGQVGGTYNVDFANLSLLATGGPVGPFQYVYVYDDTPTAPADPLVAYFIHSEAVTLSDGEAIDLIFHSDGFYDKT